MKTQASLAAGFLSVIGGTACCFGPLLLVSLGLSGAWAARMHELTPAQPYFIALAAVFVGFAFHQLYIKPRRCGPADACAATRVLRNQRIAFLIVVAIIAAMASFPLFADLFY
jgi:mercuric ion transport protein